MGVLDCLILRNDQWQRMSPHIIRNERTRGSSGALQPLFVEAERASLQSLRPLSVR